MDAFGGLDDALAYAAKAAGLKDGAWHAEYLASETDPFTQFLMSSRSSQSAGRIAGGDLAAVAASRQQETIAAALAEARRLTQTRGMQAYCLECPRLPASAPRSGDAMSLLSRLSGIFGITAD